MARISDRLVVQLVDDRLVVVNDSTGDEIEIRREEIAGFLAACEYLIGHIDPPIPPFRHPPEAAEPGLRAQGPGVEPGLR